MIIENGQFNEETIMLFFFDKSFSSYINSCDILVLSLNLISSYVLQDKNYNFNMILIFMNENIYFQCNFSNKMTTYLNSYKAGGVYISTATLSRN